MYVLKGEKVPKVRVLPKARYKVRINIEIEQKDENIKVLEKIISSMDNISGILSKGWTKTDEN